MLDEFFPFMEPLLTSPLSVSNLGGTFPRFFILRLVDFFTTATCTPRSAVELADLKLPISNPITSPFSCVLEPDKHRCTDGGGVCHIQRDGYYVTNIICVIIGIVTFVAYIRPRARQLQALPLRAWRLGEGVR